MYISKINLRSKTSSSKKISNIDTPNKMEIIGKCSYFAIKN